MLKQFKYAVLVSGLSFDGIENTPAIPFQEHEAGWTGRMGARGNLLTGESNRKYKALQGYQRRLQAYTRLYKAIQGYLRFFTENISNMESELNIARAHSARIRPTMNVQGYDDAEIHFESLSTAKCKRIEQEMQGYARLRKPLQAYARVFDVFDISRAAGPITALSG